MWGEQRGGGGGREGGHVAKAKHLNYVCEEKKQRGVFFRAARHVGPPPEVAAALVQIGRRGLPRGPPGRAAGDPAAS